MKRFAHVVAFLSIAASSTLSPLTARAADSLAIAEMEENYKRLNAELEELKVAYVNQHKRIEAVVGAINSIRSDMEKNAATASSYVTREDLRKLAKETSEKLSERLSELEQKRQNDQKIILDQLEKVAKMAAEKPAPVVIQAPRPPQTNYTERSTNGSKPDKLDKEKEKEKSREKETTTSTNSNLSLYPYKVVRGDTLGTIVTAFNAEFKSKGKPTITKADVIKANPKLNPDKLLVGMEILIPLPPE